jgi:uncharacterized DUF497 family protein
MSNNKSKTIERLRKLLALARGGVGGEAENAEQFLKTRLAKHGLTMADLEESDDPPRPVHIAYKNAMDKRLLLQVLGMVKNVSTVAYWENPGRSIDVELTTAQAAEVSIYMDAHRAGLERHLENAYIAYVSGNNIFGANPEDDDENPEPNVRSQEDLAAIRAMLRGVKPITVRKAIEGQRA